MHIDRDIFLMIVNNAEPAWIQNLDKQMCGCNFIYHWVYHMQRGSWNPKINELDYELRDVRTADQLYDFLISRQNAIQEQ